MYSMMDTVVRIHFLSVIQPNSITSTRTTLDSKLEEKKRILFDFVVSTSHAQPWSDMQWTQALDRDDEIMMKIKSVNKSKNINCTNKRKQSTVTPHHRSSIINKQKVLTKILNSLNNGTITFR